MKLELVTHDLAQNVAFGPITEPDLMRNALVPADRDRCPECPPLTGVITDDMLDRLRARNAWRLRECTAGMGALWLLHPDNRKERKT